MAARADPPRCRVLPGGGHRRPADRRVAAARLQRALRRRDLGSGSRRAVRDRVRGRCHRACRQRGRAVALCGASPRRRRPALCHDAESFLPQVLPPVPARRGDGDEPRSRLLDLADDGARAWAQGGHAPQRVSPCKALPGMEPGAAPFSVALYTGGICIRGIHLRIPARLRSLSLRAPRRSW